MTVWHEWRSLSERFWFRPERVLERRCRQLNRRIREVGRLVRAAAAEIEQARRATTETFQGFDRALFRLEMANGHDPTQLLKEGGHGAGGSSIGRGLAGKRPRCH